MSVYDFEVICDVPNELWTLYYNMDKFLRKLTITSAPTEDKSLFVFVEEFVHTIYSNVTSTSYSLHRDNAWRCVLFFSVMNMCSYLDIDAEKLTGAGLLIKEMTESELGYWVGKVNDDENRASDKDKNLFHNTRALCLILMGFDPAPDRQDELDCWDGLAYSDDWYDHPDDLEEPDI